MGEAAVTGSTSGAAVSVGAIAGGVFVGGAAVVAAAGLVPVVAVGRLSGGCS